MLARINYRTTIAAVAVAVACVTSGVPSALAQTKPVTVYAPPSEGVRTVRVSYRDLNLASQSGEKMLTSRVGSAVRQACSNEGGGISSLDNDYFTCARGAWGDARPQMARAITRAHEIALNGTSSIAATAITISIR